MWFNAYHLCYLLELFNEIDIRTLSCVEDKTAYEININLHVICNDGSKPSPYFNLFLFTGLIRMQNVSPFLILF